MAGRWRHNFRWGNSGRKPQEAFILLDRFSVADIRRWKDFQDQILKFHWDYYSTLAYQRSQVIDQLRQAIQGVAKKSFTFKHWQRALKYKYALKPLSVAGSLVDPGGRFNIGDINPSQFPPFPALYIASDKDTALQELLSQKMNQGQEQKALDFALTRPDSIANVSLSGKLDSLIDLTKPETLKPFIELIKDFKAPEYLIKAARSINLPDPELIRSVPKLTEALIDPNWRLWSMQFDVPVTSQIFGQLTADAGIDGILYKSKFTGKNCLAIYPQNFDEPPGSYIQLDDEAPKEVEIHTLDSMSWKQLQEGER